MQKPCQYKCYIRFRDFVPQRSDSIEFCRRSSDIPTYFCEKSRYKLLPGGRPWLGVQTDLFPKEEAMVGVCRVGQTAQGSRKHNCFDKARCLRPPFRHVRCVWVKCCMQAWSDRIGNFNVHFLLHIQGAASSQSMPQDSH